jgi:hypothetical protein
MTLVAGFTGRDGIVLCADNESLYGDYSKKRVEKIKWGRKNRADFSYAIAAATDSEEYVQMVESDLQFGVMERFEVYEPEKIHEAIKRYLHEFHLQHVWPRTDSAAAPRIHTLIVLHPDSSARAYPLLLHTTETAVNIVLLHWRRSTPRQFHPRQAGSEPRRQESPSVIYRCLSIKTGA